MGGIPQSKSRGAHFGDPKNLHDQNRLAREDAAKSGIVEDSRALLVQPGPVMAALAAENLTEVSDNLASIKAPDKSIKVQGRLQKEFTCKQTTEVGAAPLMGDGADMQLNPDVPFACMWKLVSALLLPLVLAKVIRLGPRAEGNTLQCGPSVSFFVRGLQIRL
jgi:hypothetical protein